jgi:hypothetical protein
VPSLPLQPRAALAAGIACACAAGPLPAQPSETAAMPPTCLSSGNAQRMAGALRIDAPITRAVWLGTDGARGGIEIELLGTAEAQAAAASGRVLQQVGLRLRVQDPCNAIYVTWPLGPDARLRVLAKLNAGRSTFAACGARGYRSLVPAMTAEFAPLRIGEPRRLEAAIADRQLTVAVDGTTVWRGAIGSDAARLTGPVGLRSDNLRLRLRWIGPAPAAAHEPDASGRPAPACRRLVQAPAPAATA